MLGSIAHRVLAFNRQRSLWLVVTLLVGTLGAAIATNFLRGAEPISRATFQRLRAGMTSEEVEAILGKARNRRDANPLQGAIVHPDRVEDSWGAEGSYYHVDESAKSGAGSYCGQFSYWYGPAYRIEIEWNNESRVIGAACLRRGDVPFSIWERAVELLSEKTGLTL
jgi:hypothetical protein